MTKMRRIMGGRANLIYHFTRLLDVVLIAILTSVLLVPATVQSDQSTDAAGALTQIGVTRFRHPPTAPGQSATLLPDGRWLLVGGTLHPEKLQVLDIIQNSLEDIPAHLSVPRSGHTANLMPDGTVLILGGIGTDGAVVGQAEQLDVVSNVVTALGNLGLEARAYQSAIVLADGRLLIVGGVGSNQEPVLDAEIYNPGAHGVEVLAHGIDGARLGPSAALTLGGSVVLWGGTDASGRPLASALEFDPSNEKFAAADASSLQRWAQSLSGTTAPTVALGLPEWSARDVSVSDPLVVRFSHPMDVRTLNENSVTLIGPNGAAALKAVPVDEGLLLFLTPLQDLAPATDYTLFISGAALASGRPLPFTSIGFTTRRLTANLDAQGSRAATAPNARIAPNPSARGQPDGTAASKTGTGGATPESAARETRAAAVTTRETRAGVEALAALKSSAGKITANGAAALDEERWIPGPDAYRGKWTSGHKALARQTMPKNDLLKRALYGNPEILALMDTLTPATVASGVLRNLVPRERLEGPAGVTAVTGQTLRLNGQPLSNVTLAIGSHSVQTDANGEFTLAGVPAGHQILVIDGGTAGQQGHQYGRYEYGMTVIAGRTIALPFIIWMTALDTKDALAVSSPTVGQTTLTNPDIPGLELRIPAGTVIRDAAGKIVTRISMTAIPIDQPPFPLPNVPVPVYFTVQPGGGYLEGAGGHITPGAQLIYPNFTHSPSGTRMNFWNYDAAGKGWYVYGQGSVTADGKQIMPDPSVAIYEFSGAMVASPSTAPSNGPPPGGCQSGDPVDCFTGLFVNDEVDLKIPDVMPIELRRVYRPRDASSRAFGIGTNLSYDLFTVGTSFATPEDAYTYQDLILPNGAHIHYPRVSQGTSYIDAVYQNTSTPGAFYGSVIKRIGQANFYWALILRDGTTYGFLDSEYETARDAAAQVIIDRNGNTVTLSRDSAANLTQITSPNGHHLNLTYDDSNRVTQASDDLGRTVVYVYDSLGRLVRVTDPAGHIERYTYDGKNNMLTVTDKRGHVRVTNTYDVNSRVKTQTYADGTHSSFAYTLDKAGTTVTQTNYTDQRGVIARMLFNGSGYPTQVTNALGRPEQQILSYIRNATTNLVDSVTDALNRTTALTYDLLGNATSVTRLAGTASAVTTRIQYNVTYSEPTLLTDPNGNTTQIDYDTAGNLLRVTDALNHASSLTYDAQGRPQSITDANGNTTSLSYFGADINRLTNALGNSSFFGADLVGRLVSITNPVGAQTANVYDVLDDLTVTTDPIGAANRFAYDANSNLLTHIDPNAHSTTFTYDALNRVVSQTDALLKTQSYAYEPGGLIDRYIDRKGQVRGWTYDGLGRPIKIGFGATTVSPTAYKTTIAETWDGGDRLTELVDTVSGTITRAYDGLDRLIKEATPRGTVSYSYDAAGRRTAMTVLGQPTVTYSWDAANRLIKMQQAAGAINGNKAQTISFEYDAANRRTKLVLSSGVEAAYAYDTASHLTAISYTRANGASIGNLTYTYDAAGYRTSVGGSLANVRIPASAFSGDYDANNRLSKLNGLALTYDNNGSTINDGTNTYTWDARNQLQSISGAVSANFEYDAVGRRVKKTIGSTTKGYLYDGINFVNEENAAGAVTATLLTGGVDELFARMTSAGTHVPLTDALGSVIAEANSAQAVTTSYAYDPYGNTTETGTSSGNTQQYTGRENDGTGLYFYRARYYNPKAGRFISEDPIGAAGGPNFYAYVRDNPVSMLDPSGLLVFYIGLSGGAGYDIGAVGATGFVFDSSHNWGGYYGGGGGFVTPGADVGISFGFLGSIGNTPTTISNFGGTFDNASIGFAAGAYGAIDGFIDPQNPRNFGAGITLGVGTPGVGGSLSRTDTVLVTPSQILNAIRNAFKAISTCPLSAD
jgi:RHS repeat-associated protein